MPRRILYSLPLVSRIVKWTDRRLSADDDSDDTVKESDQLLNTFYINMFIFSVLLVVFELVRHFKSIYLNRMKRKYIETNRVPPPPGKFPLAWVYSVLIVSQEDVLRMIGLDAYMLLRFLLLCLRIASFFAFFGVIVLAPIYHSGKGNNEGWNAFTIANILDTDGGSSLWAPVAFAYFFSIFYCQLMYYEYKNFIHKRVQFLVEGDSDTQVQTNYTVRVENLPASLQSTPMLADFFERLYPGEVFSVEIALDLKELEALCVHRKQVRNWLEKAIASRKATGSRPLVWVAKSFYTDLQRDYQETLSGLVGQPSGDARDPGDAFPPMPATSGPSLHDLLARLPKHISSRYLSSFALALGCHIYDAVQHYGVLLAVLNRYIYTLQQHYEQQRTYIDRMERSKLLEVKKFIYARSIETGAKQVRNIYSSISNVWGSTKKESRVRDYDTFSTMHSPPQNDLESAVDAGAGEEYCVGANSTSGSAKESLLSEHSNRSSREPSTATFRTSPDTLLVGERRSRSSSRDSAPSTRSAKLEVSFDCVGESKGEAREESTAYELATTASVKSSAAGHPHLHKLNKHLHKHLRKIREGTTTGLSTGKELAKMGMENITKEGIKTAEYATKGVLRGVLEATRALELLTIGAYYRVSSTAFVTFKTRVASLCSTQMLLSHDYYRLHVTPAVNVNDIIWENIHLPQKQIHMRSYISTSIYVVGALFWSLVVAFISAVTSLESISQEIPSLKQYSNTELYTLLNYYLAMGVLLILLALLPYVFDFISRTYEGIKLESEVQSNIMRWYFIYILANIYVAVGLGSVASSLHNIVNSPTSVLQILGDSVASFSIYFANMLITRTFTGIPIEMLRLFNLLDIGLAYLCFDKKRLTHRQLRTGAFADCPMLYGWIYPNILMGLMIMCTYACIAPLILPLCMVFFASSFLMYKYQLLYVYINKSVHGGAMWYNIYDQSMLVLIYGQCILICYLAIRHTYATGPLYAMVPLPFCVYIFWSKVNKQFSLPAKQLSLERAKEIDKAMYIYKDREHIYTPVYTFRPFMYRQPSLCEGMLRPAAYRHASAAPHSHNSSSAGSAGGRKTTADAVAPLSDSNKDSGVYREDSLDSLNLSLSHGNNQLSASVIAFDEHLYSDEDGGEEGEEVDREVSLFLGDNDASKTLTATLESGAADWKSQTGGVATGEVA